MSYPASLALFVCALTVVSIACFLPFLNSTLKKKQRPKFPLWTVLFASVALLNSLVTLLGPGESPADIMGALGLTAALIAGISIKWLMETIAQKKPMIHEAILFRAMLAAPLATAFLPGLFGLRPTPPALLLWFLNGFFWYAVCSDLARLTTREEVIIRRREPPTLPYDFRKPEID